MKATLQAGTDQLDLAFDSLEEIDEFLAATSKQEGFFVDLPRSLKLFQAIQCSAASADGFAFRFPAEVVQVFRHEGTTGDPIQQTYGTALQIRDWNSIPLTDLERRIREAQDREPQASPEEAEPEEKPPPHASEVSPIFRLRQMKPPERFRLAASADRVERQLLVRDTSPHVLLGLLSNPRIEESDVLEIVKSPYSSAGTMHRIADSRKWMANREIRLAIVRSPKTPSPAAIKLLPTLLTEDLRTLSKMGNAREVLRKAALRIYLQRTSRHG